MWERRALVLRFLNGARGVGPRCRGRTTGRWDRDRDNGPPGAQLRGPHRGALAAGRGGWAGTGKDSAGAERAWGRETLGEAGLWAGPGSAKHRMY